MKPLSFMKSKLSLQDIEVIMGSLNSVYRALEQAKAREAADKQKKSDTNSKRRSGGADPSTMIPYSNIVLPKKALRKIVSSLVTISPSSLLYTNAIHQIERT